jgi:hypothetical protein
MDNNQVFSRPYMGNLTSAQIGQMARAGELGGEMVRRMVAMQEAQMAKDYENSQHEMMINDQNNSIG